VLVVACFVAFLRLGWWQWDRAHAAGGGAQNLGYALQWPLFALFVLFGWGRVLRLELAKSKPDSAPAPEPAVRARRRPLPRVEPPAVDDEPDDELAAYNRHLAWLHEQDQQRSRGKRT
jgi:DNA-binding transcriptional regulator of glucitol operon